MMDFGAAVRGFAVLDHEVLSRPWGWRGGMIDARYALYRALEEAQEAQVRVAAGLHPEPRRILGLAQRAFGDLRGLLAGLPAERLDAAPRAGEWSIRETLHHLIVIERRYAVQTLYAVERADTEPVRIPDARLPRRRSRPAATSRRSSRGSATRGRRRTGRSATSHRRR